MNDFIVRSYTQRLVAVVVCVVLALTNVQAGDIQTQLKIPTYYATGRKEMALTYNDSHLIFARKKIFDQVGVPNFLLEREKECIKEQIFKLSVAWAQVDTTSPFSYRDKQGEWQTRSWYEELCCRINERRDLYLVQLEVYSLLSRQIKDCLRSETNKHGKINEHVKDRVVKKLKEQNVPDGLLRNFTCDTIEAINPVSHIIDKSTESQLKDLVVVLLQQNPTVENTKPVEDFCKGLFDITFTKDDDKGNKNIADQIRDDRLKPLLNQVADMAANRIVSELNELAKELPKDFGRAEKAETIIKKGIAAAVFAFVAACIAAYNDADFIAMPAALASLVSGMFAAYKGYQWMSYEEPEIMRGLLKDTYHAQKREAEQSELQ